MRIVRLKQFLTATQPDYILYEDVKFVGSHEPGATATAILARAASSLELIGALRAAVVEWAHHRSVPCQGIPIGALKRRATGKGNANKEQMIEACNRLYGTDMDPDTYKETGADNIADAAHLLSIAVEQCVDGLPE